MRGGPVAECSAVALEKIGVAARPVLKRRLDGPPFDSERVRVVFIPNEIPPDLWRTLPVYIRGLHDLADVRSCKRGEGQASLHDDAPHSCEERGCDGACEA